MWDMQVFTRQTRKLRKTATQVNMSADRLQGSSLKSSFCGAMIAAEGAIAQLAKLVCLCKSFKVLSRILCIQREWCAQEGATWTRA